MSQPTPQLHRTQGYWVGGFQAMASPCELLLEVASEAEARGLLEVVVQEVRRIEYKFSRYRDDNIIARINHSRGSTLEVDEETADLLDFAAHCFQLSEGRFDVTSGVLRELWQFDGATHALPDADQIAQILPRIGWHRVRWQRPHLRLPAGMEIDFGGIGKEYAVDRALALVRQLSEASVLINLGGDLAVTAPRLDGSGWQVGLDSPQTPGQAHIQVALQQGALATSGDSRRFMISAGEGVQLGHILDPRSGRPIEGAPRSVTVAAPTCSEAGILATVAILQGHGAQAFLEQQQVRYWAQD